MPKSSSRLPRTTARDAPENLAILLREPFRTLSEQLIERLAQRGHPDVRYPHGNVLQYLDDGGTRVGVLADRAGMTRQSMTQLVEHLERHGYVERVADPSDGRAQLVRATRRGDDVFTIVREFVTEVEAQLHARLGAAKLARLRALLRELDEALGGA